MSAPAIDQCPDPGRPRADPLERRRPRQSLCRECHHHPPRRADAERDRTHAGNDAVIRQALEKAGVEFIDENGGGPGVRLRVPSQKS